MRLRRALRGSGGSVGGGWSADADGGTLKLQDWTLTDECVGS